MTSHRDAITGEYVTAEHAAANPDSDDSAAATPTLALDALRDYSRRARAAAAFVDPPGALSPNALDKLDALIAHADQPIVRTVGDLTHKHIGKGVRVFEGPHFILRGLLTFARGEETDYAELAADWDDGADDWDFIELPLDTPCEVES